MCIRDSWPPICPLLTTWDTIVFILRRERIHEPSRPFVTIYFTTYSAVCRWFKLKGYFGITRNPSDECPSWFFSQQSCVFTYEYSRVVVHLLLHGYTSSLSCASTGTDTPARKLQLHSSLLASTRVSTIQSVVPTAAVFHLKKIYISPRKNYFLELAFWNISRTVSVMKYV